MNHRNENILSSLGLSDYDALFNAVNQAALVSITDVQGNIIYANDLFVKISKYSRKELIGKNHRILKSGDQPDSMFVGLWKTISGGKTWRGDIKNRAKDGSYYWVDSSIAPILDQSGKPEKYIAVRFLISTKKEIELNLINSNKSLQDTKKAMLNILEDLDEEKNKLETSQKELAEAQRIGKFGSFTWNLQTNDVHWSDESFYMHGWEPNKNHVPPPIKDYLSIIHPDDLEATKISMANAQKNTSENQQTYRVVWKNGEIHSIRVVSKLTLDEQGKAQILQGTFQDITKEQEVDKAKTEFVSLASHQLRTPLTSISWYTEMLLSGDAGNLSEEQKSYLSDIYASNKRMIELVNDLLNVSRIELGTFKVEFGSVNPLEIARSVIDELQPQITEKKLKLKTLFPKSIKKFPADQKLLRIILQNLMSNAVKYTPSKGKIEFEINPNKVKDHILFRVSDTGLGIPKAQQEKIFSKLFRADNVTKTDAEGTGLGLYIVKWVIEESGGKIWFESKENKGTSFFVTLPKKIPKNEHRQKNSSSGR